jgi:hypothetical protein
VYVGSNKPSPEIINIIASEITTAECMCMLAKINPKPIPRPIKPAIPILFSLKCFNSQGYNNAREVISQTSTSVNMLPIIAGPHIDKYLSGKW